MKKRVLILLPLLLALVLLVVLGRERLDLSPTSRPASEAREVRVVRGKLAAHVEATGRVEAVKRAQLSLPVGALVLEIPVEIGDEVGEGEPLLELDREELELRRQEAAAALAAAEAQLAHAQNPASPAEIEAAQAQLRAAQLALTVAEVKLADLPEEEQAESEEAVEVEHARAAVEQARAALRRLIDGAGESERGVLAAQVEQARARLAQMDVALEQSTLRAPFAGTIVERLVREGERIAPNQPLLSLADLDTLVIAAEVDEVDVGQVAVGQAVTVTLDAFPATPLEGRVRRIAPASGAQRAATTYRTVIGFAPGELPIRLDMAADLRIRTLDVSDTLLLPVAAIRYAETQPYVLVQRGQQAVEQQVVVGAQDGQMVEILEGVEEGERILLP